MRPARHQTTLHELPRTSATWIACADRVRLGGPGAKGRTMTSTIARPREKKEQRTQGLPPYNVVLLDDDDHSFEYVIRMLNKVFGHPPEKGYRMAVGGGTTGRGIVATTKPEDAEVKSGQKQTFGPSPL